MQQEGFYPNLVPLKRPSLLVFAAISFLLALPAAPGRAVLTDSTISRFFQAYHEARRVPQWKQHASTLSHSAISTVPWGLSGQQITVWTQAEAPQQAIRTLWLQTAQPIRAGPPLLYPCTHPRDYHQ